MTTLGGGRLRVDVSNIYNWSVISLEKILVFFNLVAEEWWSLTGGGYSRRFDCISDQKQPSVHPEAKKCCKYPSSHKIFP